MEAQHERLPTKPFFSNGFCIALAIIGVVSFSILSIAAIIFATSTVIITRGGKGVHTLGFCVVLPMVVLLLRAFSL